MNNNHNIRVSIGLPVYNGEKFLRKRIESLLNQTFGDFELIISDNASTDYTQAICEEYARKDKRIRYIRQERNMGAAWNFNFVLKEARHEYFVWVAVDDILMPTFLERNIRILEEKKDVVCSVSKIEMFGSMTEYLKDRSKDSMFIKIKKKIIKKIGYMDTFPIYGSYEERIKKFFKTCRHSLAFYGVYRTKQLHDNNLFLGGFVGLDTAFSLDILKYGDIYVIDEILMHVFDGGESRSGMIGATRNYNKNIIGIIFPFYSFTQWCLKHLGIGLFTKNIGFFIKINFIGEFSLCVDTVRLITRIISRK